MNFIKISFYIALITCFQNAALAQEWLSYQSQQQINDLVETEYEMHLATDAGLVVMDKTTLEKTIFNKANSNLSNNHIQSITMAPNGDTWIGTYDVVLGMFDGSGFQEITIPEGDAFDQFTELYDFKIAPNGDLWVGTTDGIFHRQGQTWSHYDADVLGPMFFEAWDIEINAAGDVFVGSNGVFKFSNGQWSDILEDTEMLGYLDAELFFSNSGDLFFAGDLERVGRYDGTNWQIYDVNNPGDFDAAITPHQIIGFTEDAAGNIYLNTQQEGIFKLEGDSWKQQENAPTSYYHIDDQGKHWLNHNIYLSVDNNGAIETASISETSLESNSLHEIHKSADGSLFFIMNSSTNSIARLSPDGNWSLLAIPAPATLWGFFGDILFLNEDDIWLATYEGLYHYDGNEWSFDEIGPCARLEKDSQGRIFVQGATGIHVVENGTITTLTTNNSPLASGIINGLGVDSEDNLWIAFIYEGAIQKVTPTGDWTSYTAANYPVIDQPEGRFHFDLAGNVWIADDVVGAIKFDGETWTNPIADNITAMENYSVYSIESDAAGKLYFSHHFGVTTLLDGEWEDLIIEDVPFNYSHGSTIKFDDEGTLWWASNRYGVFTYTPEDIVNDTPSDTPIILDFSVYPNPASEFVTIDLGIEQATTVKILIFNETGQLVSRFNLGQVSAGNIQTEIPLQGLSTGLYNILVKTDGQTYTSTIFVN